MEHSAYQTAFKSLNKAQKEAVETIEGPVMVVAGPGTGKTQILTLRIAQILKHTDTKPENILALTFTESGARAMRERLRSYIGSEAYRVPIYTFHGFAELLIRQYPDAYQKVAGGRPARDVEKIQMLEDILSSTYVKILKPLGNTAYYIPHIMNAISKMKQEYITPDTFLNIIEQQERELLELPKLHEKGAHKGKVRSEYAKKETGILKNRELLYIYRVYESLFVEKGRYDFDDMILETVLALKKNENMLRDLQETYQYILADEHQDVNGSQNEILDLLASYHEQPNIFVVGDEKQAIFRFQGASLENFLYFEDRFVGTKTIALTQNYRSGQNILDSAHSLIATDAGPASDLRVPLTAELVKESHVERREFSHQAVEDDWLVSAVQALTADNVEPKEIAIILRTNREVEDIAVRLRKAGISASASADGDILTHGVTHTVRALIDAVIHTRNEEGICKVLHGSYWGISAGDLVLLLSARRFDMPITRLISDEITLQKIGIQNYDEVLHVCAVLEEARKQNGILPPHRVLGYVLNESGYLDMLMRDDPMDGGRVIRRLYDEIEEMVTRDGVKDLEGVQQVFDSLVAHTIPLKAPYISTNENSVQVLTAHKSKGLEFEHVFIPHLVDSAWGGRRKAEYFSIPVTKKMHDSDANLDDERRLLYVAMTRAKLRLYLSSSDINTEGKEFIPSRFFEEISEQHIKKIDTDAEEENFDPTQSLRVKKGNGVAIDTSLLMSLLGKRGLSATALNNYLEDPWTYFYRNVLRFPEIQAPPMLYGTALHSVLEEVTRMHTKEGKLVTDTDIKKLLDKALGKLPITKEEFVTLHERGFTALTTYVAHLYPELPKTTKEEFALRVVLETGDPIFPELTLTGKLDRLDFDTEGNVSLVVDYKSGKPKTKGQIEGTTKDSNGNYKRQLVFYALLLSLYDDERYACREYKISFVEPKSNGDIVEYSHTITKGEIEELKHEILRVTKEIVNGAFLNAPPLPDSPYAHLVNELSNRI